MPLDCPSSPVPVVSLIMLGIARSPQPNGVAFCRAIQKRVGFIVASFFRLEAIRSNASHAHEPLGTTNMHVRDSVFKLVSVAWASDSV